MAAHALDRLATGQVTLTTAAVQIVAARRERVGVKIVKHGSQDAFVGASAVTTGTGVLLAGDCGTFYILPTTDAVYGTVAAGTLVVSYLEIYDA